MLKNLLKNIKFQSIINNFFNKNKDKVIDILLFGSIVREKEKPKDVDILIIYKTKPDIELEYNLRKNLEKIYIKAEITSVSYKDLFKPTFLIREAFLSEAYSLINKKFISKALGYSNFILFKYNINKFNKSQRMRFYYSLYGRKKEDKGILQRTNSYKFSDRIIITPIDKSEAMREYLDNWNISYLDTPILLPTRIVESKKFRER